MNINYFADTDTALLEFTDSLIKETLELSENIYLDIDENGNPVNLTIEHASTVADLPDISYHHIKKEKVLA
jgi:uncharacterized protein YuzE